MQIFLTVRLQRLLRLRLLSTFAEFRFRVDDPNRIFSLAFREERVSLGDVVVLLDGDHCGAFERRVGPDRTKGRGRINSRRRPGAHRLWVFDVVVS